MRLRERLNGRRRLVLAATACLAVAGAISVAVPALADDNVTGYCNVNTGNLKICVFRSGDLVYAGAYANPEIYSDLQVQLDGMTVKCTNGSCADHAFTVFMTTRSSPVNGDFDTGKGNWRFGLSQYAVHHYLGQVTATRRGTAGSSGQDIAKTNWIDAKAW